MNTHVKEPKQVVRTARATVVRRLTAVRNGLVAAMACLALAAPAAPVSFGFAGQVTDDAINGCGALVACGVLSGSYSFDSSATDGNAAANLGLYAASAISFLIDGALFFSATNGVINVVNFTTTDQYGLLATGLADNGSTAELSILLEDLSALAFGSDALPLTPSALTALLPGGFTLFATDDTFQLQGRIDSITCTSGCDGGTGPEPGSTWLAAAGLAVLGIARRRGRS